MNYSNTNTVLLGMVIERVIGQPIAQFFQTNLLAKNIIAALPS